MDDELTDRQMQFALISQKLKNIKTRFQFEGNTTGELNLMKSSATDHSGNVKQILSSNSPETCLSFLMKTEERGNPKTDSNLLRKLIDIYSQVLASLPIEKHCKNESYARILVRFAELKAIQEPDNACDDFNMARVNCKIFAFVHVAHAQYELSQGNLKKSTSILQKAWDMNAKPIELLETAMSNLRSGKMQLLSPEDKENMIVPTYHSMQDSKSSKNHDGTGDMRCTLAVSQGINQKSSSLEEVDVGWKQTQFRKSDRMPLMTPDTFSLKRGDPSGLGRSMKRQTSGTRANRMFAPLLSKSSQIRVAGDGDSFRLSSWKPTSNVSPVNSVDQGVSTADSTMTLFNKTDTSVTAKREETWSQVPAPLFSSQLKEQVVSNHSKIFSSVGKQSPKPSYMETVSEWKIPARIGRQISPENKQSPAEQPNPQQSQDRLPASNREVPGFVYETPNAKMSCIIRTPVVKEPRVVAEISTPYNYRSVYQQPGQNVSSTPYRPSTSFNQVSCSQQFQQVPPVHSNDYIMIKGKNYYVLKQIGRGGSSKVFQVLDHKKQLFAVKYVNLEDADNQTIESYKNEIEHLNRLQQHSDQIIKLYDYEITNSYIYMLMECGNLDLNSWLRSKKAVNPLERKFYWKNMLEAVQTIHQIGIIHSDLKPANFVIVNASLKLIDFGIANQIQPDVTSIVKDSQVGTLNYMPPEAIKDNSSIAGKPRSKISPKSDVWSLGCILYCMTYGKTPFQHITNQITKLQAIIDPSYEIEFPDIPEKDLRDVLMKCLVRNPKERVSISELLRHSYLQMQLQPAREPEQQITSQELKRIFNELASINSPNSISRAANNLAKMCNSGIKLDVSECMKSSSNPV
ncbi:dual specificity protein kinase Ttk-like [Polyodon spathula]|uniref:dual specificity protein kinase Ttk-like n=1 Tax=Polyodon spathula TaxID=7913 RepID=UPI001B7F6124|nr:dual specificity protein kinase Ttk-like [Polyodon spathula]